MDALWSHAAWLPGVFVLIGFGYNICKMVVTLFALRATKPEDRPKILKALAAPYPGGWLSRRDAARRPGTRGAD